MVFHVGLLCGTRLISSIGCGCHGNASCSRNAPWLHESWPLTWGQCVGGVMWVSSCLKRVKALHWLAVICLLCTLICVIGILSTWNFVLIQFTRDQSFVLQTARMSVCTSDPEMKRINWERTLQGQSCHSFLWSNQEKEIGHLLWII